jgi:hypothetical protein
MGALMDPDVGVHDDDMVGTLLNDSVAGVGWVQNVGFVGDNDNHEEQNARGQWEEGTPGVVAYKFLESPKGPDGETPLGMTAFKKFTIDIDPVTDQSQYLTMAGYDYRTGVFTPYDSVDVAPADKRFVQCSGPFNLAPGGVEVLIVACVASVYCDEGESWASRRSLYNDKLADLGRLANSAQFIYDQGWLLPGPPPSPSITLVPGDNTVRIVWDNLSEAAPDKYWEKVAGNPESPGYDPKYLPYDFQGYIVYKSLGGADWGILTQVDKADSIMFDYPPSGDSAVPDSLWIRATDSGIRYSAVDNDVVNGYNYFYCVTAYDWNFITTEKDTLGNPVAWDTLILRSGIIANWSAVPRWNPVNYIPPEVTVTTTVGDTVMPGLALTSSVVVPYDVTATPYRLRFLGPEYVGTSRTRYHYFVEDPADGSLIVDTAAFTYTVGADFEQSVPVFNGQELSLALTVDIPSRAYDTAYVVSGSYPPEKVRAASSVTQQALWAFRGADYRIEWATLEGSGLLTAKVYDETHGGLEVPFAPFTTTGQGPQNANGWCFVDNAFRAPTDTLKTKSANIYICGGFVALNYNSETGRGDTLGAMISSIQAGDEWMALGHKGQGTAPMYNEYAVTAVPGTEDTDSTYALNVKVVPNPYIVFDEWESKSENRMLKFTHLPMNCTVRIFTLSGDLVKALVHTHNGDSPQENGGTESWDLLNSNDQLIASGVYMYHVESDVGEFTGKFAVIH